MKKRVRISDVAELARVSPATVSAVVNNQVGDKIRVSAETQKRVWDAVAELGYVANPVAQSLARGRKSLIGIFTYESIFPIDHQNFYYPFLVGVEQEAERQGYNLLLFTNTGPDQKRSAYTNNTNQLQLADGAIFLGLNENEQELAHLLDEGFPIVFIGRRELADSRIPFAGADYVTGTKDVVRYIASQGHRHIAYVRSFGDWEANQDRQKGFCTGVEAAGLRTDIQRVERADVTAAALGQWLERGITAFVAENDELGYALLGAAESLDLRPPENFSLAVLGQPLSPYETIPDWTSFRIPRQEMGAHAVQLLIKLLDQQLEVFPPPNLLLPCTLVKGTTVGRPPQEER
ncbi:MAG: LacI family DNA-binding transcriptional regulator [Candidatus Promineifilaceae bacterium]